MIFFIFESTKSFAGSYYASAAATGTNAFTTCSTGYHVCSGGEWYKRKYDTSLGTALSATNYWITLGETSCSGSMNRVNWSSATSRNSGWTQIGTDVCAGSWRVLCCSD